jgi:hypothetical protein
LPVAAIAALFRIKQPCRLQQCATLRTHGSGGSLRLAHSCAPPKRKIRVERIVGNLGIGDRDWPEAWAGAAAQMLLPDLASRTFRFRFDSVSNLEILWVDLDGETFLRRPAFSKTKR